ncbi:MAG TPA: SDR family oxidoreductase, partial [Candidatus Babeliales bacterium]|nr:SDR family oxidoreductase [Candidatus Babeliales bacterium]
MKIIITGALGHIGSKLIRILPKHFDNLKVIMVDDLSTQRYCSLFNLPTTANYSFIESKVRDIAWDQILEDTEVVIHLSALTDAAGTADKPELVYQNNFESTQLLADACLKAKVPMMFPSSTSIYGSQSKLVDEDCKDLQPQSPYAACKIKEENYLKELFQKKLSGVICRFGTIYGTSPGMRFHTAVNKFCFQAIMNQPITVWETALHQKRPYLSVEDCCDAIIWIIKNRIYNGQIYNIVSNNFTVNNVIDEIKKHKPSLKIQFVQHKIMNQLSY